MQFILIPDLALPNITESPSGYHLYLQLLIIAQENKLCIFIPASCMASGF